MIIKLNIEPREEFTRRVEVADPPLEGSAESGPMADLAGQNYAKQTQFQNYKNRASRIVHRKNAKRTPFIPNP